MGFTPPEGFAGAKEFSQETVEKLRSAIGKEKVYLTISGGVDSAAVGCMLYEAVGSNLVAEHYDHGGMRKGESGEVISQLNPHLEVSLHDASGYFMKRVVQAGQDAEKKRDAISTGYFLTALERLESFGCKFMADGTIEPDWLETVKLGLKWQHNIPNDEIRRVYEGAGIQFIHPLYHQTKPESRAIAGLYGVEFRGRQPFPGPGLYVRCVGQVTPEKMRVAREADSIATPRLGKIIGKMNVPTDKQYFCAILDSESDEAGLIRGGGGMIRPAGAQIYKARVTGMVNNARTYRRLLSVQSDADIPDLIAASSGMVGNNADQNIGRAGVNLRSRCQGNYVAVLRAVQTVNFKTAGVIPVPRADLESLADELLGLIPEINAVVFDVTPKPPGTIEFE